MFYHHGQSQAIDNAWEHACQERVRFFSVEKNGCFRVFSESCGSCRKCMLQRCLRRLFLETGDPCFPILGGIFSIFVADINGIHITDYRVEVSSPLAPLHFPHSSFIREP